jgi:hypothetical protein
VLKKIMKRKMKKKLSIEKVMKGVKEKKTM